MDWYCLIMYAFGFSVLLILVILEIAKNFIKNNMDVQLYTLIIGACG